MKLTVILMMFFVMSMLAQAPGPPVGTVQYSAPSLAKLIASTPQTPPNVTCTITGNTSPATAISINCLVGGTQIPVYSIPLKASQNYTFQQGFGSDAVTIITQASATGVITVNGTANGSPSTGGVF